MGLACQCLVDVDMEISFIVFSLMLQKKDKYKFEVVLPEM